MSKVAVVSGDILPFPGLPTSGAGLRAWGLGLGLRGKGHEVHFLMPRTKLLEKSDRAETVSDENADLRLYDSQNISSILEDLAPDAVVVQHWPTAFSIEIDIPMAIDFHGPVMLETMYMQAVEFDLFKRMKIEAIHKGDFFTCAGEKQKHYFYSWLMLAGFDLRNTPIEVIPVSIDPELPPFEKPAEPELVYGGFLLPWHDPGLGLTAVVDRMEKHGKGKLSFYCGDQPFSRMKEGHLRDLLENLSGSDHVHVSPMIPREQLIETYLRSSAAIDVMVRNPERELAFTTRTVEYLWCGLPVIYQGYSELSAPTAEYDAGWIVDYRDAGGVENAMDEILSDPDVCRRKGMNAQRLIQDRYTWDRTVGPLHEFCSNPGQARRVLDLPQFIERGFPESELSHPPENASGVQAQTVVPAGMAREGSGGRPGETIDPFSPEIEQWLRGFADSPNLLLEKLRWVLSAQRWRIESLDKTISMVEKQKSLKERLPVFGSYYRWLTERRAWKQALMQSPRVTPEIAGNAVLGQTFRVEKDALDQVLVRFATFGRPNTQHLQYALREGGPQGPVLRDGAIWTGNLRDNEAHEIRFESVEGTAGRFFHLELRSSRSRLGDAVSVYLLEDSEGPRLTWNGKRKPGRLDLSPG